MASLTYTKERSQRTKQTITVFKSHTKQHTCDLKAKDRKYTMSRKIVLCADQRLEGGTFQPFVLPDISDGSPQYFILFENHFYKLISYEKENIQR